MKPTLDDIFGEDSQGATPEERARTSSRQYVRDQDHLAPFRQGATGRRLSAYEAVTTYGVGRLAEAVDFGAAIIVGGPEEPAKTLRERRESLGLTPSDLAKRLNLGESEILKCEDSETRSSIRVLESVASALGLDERLLSISPGAGGDSQLAVRLRTLNSGNIAAFTPAVVLTLTEAAWVIATQTRLAEALGRSTDHRALFKTSGQYSYPVWVHGYELARRTRETLSVSADAEIPNLRAICRQLQIPLALATLPKHFAGATIEAGGCRGIVVNTVGFNANVWVRRSTIAHELGHLLWDPESRLEKLQVDRYESLEMLDWESRIDPVEARANAFAIELLAPQRGVVSILREKATHEEGLRSVIEKYGISITAARYHAWNALDHKVDLDSLVARDIQPNPEWRGREGFTDDWFPLAGTLQTRRGDFAGIVVEAERESLISDDTAAAYLNATIEDYRESRDIIAGLF